MRIGELAERTGCEVETIRYYEREGLIANPARTSSGYRDYRKEHVEQLNFVRHGRSLGMGLAEIRLLLSFKHDPSLACDAIDHLLDEQVARVGEQMRALQKLEKQLKKLRASCRSARTAGQCGILRNLVDASQNTECVCHGSTKTGQ